MDSVIDRDAAIQRDALGGSLRVRRGMGDQPSESSLRHLVPLPAHGDRHRFGNGWRRTREHHIPSTRFDRVRHRHAGPDATVGVLDCSICHKPSLSGTPGSALTSTYKGERTRCFVTAQSRYCAPPHTMPAMESARADGRAFCPRQTNPWTSSIGLSHLANAKVTHVRDARSLRRMPSYPFGKDRSCDTPIYCAAVP